MVAFFSFSIFGRAHQLCYITKVSKLISHYIGNEPRDKNPWIHYLLPFYFPPPFRLSRVFFFLSKMVMKLLRFFFLFFCWISRMKHPRKKNSPNFATYEHVLEFASLARNMRQRYFHLDISEVILYIVCRCIFWQFLYQTFLPCAKHWWTTVFQTGRHNWQQQMQRRVFNR